MTGGDHTTPTPGFRGPRIPILSAWGLPLYLARCGLRFFVTGQEIGPARDNATFLHDATQDYRGKPVVRLSRARWRRVARRNALLGIPGGLLMMESASRVAAAPYEWLGNAPPGWTEVPWVEMLQGYAVGGPLAAGAVMVPRLRREWQHREVRREYVHPTWREVCQVIGHRFDRREAVRMIQLPATFGREVEAGAKPTPVRIMLPPVPLDPGVTKRLQRIGARLGMPGAVVEAHALGSATFLDVAPAALPPARVTLDTVREACEATDIDHPVIGVANGHTIVHLDFDNDSPHVALSAGSGAGKSNTLAFVLAQRMRHGSGCVILDFKKWSHAWAHGMPRENVAYVYEIAAIHGALVSVGEELMRRRALDTREELDGCRVTDIVVEEANSLIPYLNDYWTQRRAEIKAENRAALADDPDADVTEPPLRSPAVLALGAVIQMGREFGMHVFIAGQSLSTDAFGGRGRDRRASFRTRMLAAYDRSDWNMLAKGVPYVPCPSGGRGLWTVIRQSEATIVRVPQVLDKRDTSYLSRLREWALSGPVRPDTAVCPGLAGQSLMSTVSAPDGQVIDVPAQRLPLSAIVDKLPGKPLSLDGLRTASKRPGFPRPQGREGRADLYDLAAVVEWKVRREA